MAILFRPPTLTPRRSTAYRIRTLYKAARGRLSTLGQWAEAQQVEAQQVEAQQVEARQVEARRGRARAAGHHAARLRAAGLRATGPAARAVQAVGQRLAATATGVAASCPRTTCAARTRPVSSCGPCGWTLTDCVWRLAPARA